jgi:hypothetical protein
VSCPPQEPWQKHQLCRSRDSGSRVRLLRCFSSFADDLPRFRRIERKENPIKIMSRERGAKLTRNRFRPTLYQRCASVFRSIKPNKDLLKVSIWIWRKYKRTFQRHLRLSNVLNYAVQRRRRAQRSRWRAFRATRRWRSLRSPSPHNHRDTVDAE